ncbi:MAG: hypothetical protein LBU05_05100, partial [Bifidobacteriaceae bacterium]|nr:hypothetical protein [Bifidobacteriaceae bacterium]
MMARADRVPSKAALAGPGGIGLAGLGRVRAMGSVAWLVWRTSVRGALGWSLVVGVVIVFNALGYARSFPEAADREGAAASMQSGGIRLLFGTALHVDSVTGFTSWRAPLLSLILSVWAIGVAARVFRGAEENGTWSVLCGGQLTRNEVFGSVSAGLSFLAAPVWAVLCAATIVSVATTGNLESMPDCGYFAAVVMMPSLVGFGVGALTSQLMAHRRSALGLSIVVIAALYLGRGVADVRDSSLVWLSPFGWVEKAEALIAPKYGVVWLFAGTTSALLAAAWAAQRHRDLSGSIVKARDRRPDRPAWLGSVLQGQARFNARQTVGWTAGLVLLGLVTAVVTDEGGELTAASEQLGVILGETGQYDGAQGYLSLVFMALGTVVALAAAGDVMSVLRQETSGQSRTLLARPVSRIVLLGADVITDLAALAVAMAGAAAGVWLALLSQEADLSLPECL